MPPPEIDPRILGQRIAEARKSRGKTQEEVAEFLGYSRPTYIAIEKGERTAKPDEIIKLASFFGDRGDRRSTGDPSRTEGWGVGCLLPRTGQGVGRRGST